MPWPYLLKCPDILCERPYPGDKQVCPFCGAPSYLAGPAEVNPRDYVFDIETYPDVFTCAVTHPATGRKGRFEVSRRVHQGPQFVQFMHTLAAERGRMVGYNSLGFDYPVVHFVAQAPTMPVEAIYEKAQSIITSNDRFGHLIWPSDQIVEQIDLYKIWHFDNRAKSTSLKVLEFNMGMDNIGDLPFPPGTPLESDQNIEILHAYNEHDVEATTRFYARSQTAIQLREKLTASLGINVMNDSDVKMGEKILVAELEKSGISCYVRPPGGGRKIKKQTPRARIDLAEAIFPYVRFERPEFQAMRDELASKVLKQTKGVFTDTQVSPRLAAFMHPDTLTVRGTKSQEYERKKLSKLPDGFDLSGLEFYTVKDESLNCVVDGLKYKFGTGGLHASVESQVIESDDRLQLVDVDVASYYPNLAIVNQIYPAHLGPEFCPAYHGVYQTRKSYPKKLPENGAFKLALNGSFGGSNNEYSVFLDPLYTMKITVNGQLMLCMLAEQLIKVPGLKMIQCNTDGVTYLCPREYLDHTREICRWWERLTCLELEEALYSRMFIRDVNSYIAEYEDGTLKRIGAYAHLTIDEDPGTREVQWHKDWSSLVVPKAAEAALVRGVDVREFIENHDNPNDFMVRAKVPRSNRLVMRWPELPDVEIDLQKTSRVFVSRIGGQLLKIAPPTEPEGTWKRRSGLNDRDYNRVLAELRSMTQPPEALVDVAGTPWDERIHTKNQSKHVTRETGICTGWRVTECNDMSKFDWSNVNYDYYVREAEKLVNPLKRKD
jgi:hypothetical protein